MSSDIRIDTLDKPEREKSRESMCDSFENKFDNYISESNLIGEKIEKIHFFFLIFLLKQ